MVVGDRSVGYKEATEYLALGEQIAQFVDRANTNQPVATDGKVTQVLSDRGPQRRQPGSVSLRRWGLRCLRCVLRNGKNLEKLDSEGGPWEEGGSVNHSGGALLPLFDEPGVHQIIL